MTPDLPVELWQEILSLLPPHHVRKLIGVSRILFRMAMEDIYRELRFKSDDELMMKTFQKLKYPEFLADVEEENVVLKKSSKLWTWTSTKFRVQNLPKIIPHPSASILKVAGEVIPHCSETKSVKFVLHEFVAPTLFRPFLNTVFTSLGPRLHTLTVELTLFNSQLILDKNFSSALHSLAELKVIFAPSSTFRPFEEVSLDKSLASFVSGLEKTLQCLSITFSTFVDMSTFFSSVCRLSRLRIFILDMTFVEFLYSEQEQSLAHFLFKHQKTLEHLCIRKQPSRTTINDGDHLSLPDLPDLGFEFPVLHTLEFSVLSSSHLHVICEWFKNASPQGLRLLESLTLFKHSLTLDDASILFEALGATGASDGLQKLTMKVQSLDSELMDLFASRLPALRELELLYNHYRLEDDRVRGQPYFELGMFIV
ncbi:hypothetical protein H0H81_001221 [Sphagnurus paluster]|uniref:F-box domain-containing protein n=1 Tax=Sphagnurus paluster TaxID=117069 RepID=A0A9P7K6T0_9AGAR|nr:hypothetical protein H0H81_001221 [Sphagnurus paluster]